MTCTMTMHRCAHDHLIGTCPYCPQGIGRSRASSYVRGFDRWGADYCCVPAPTVRTGPGYSVGQWPDGSAVAVIMRPGESPYVLDWSDTRISLDALESLTHAARCVSTVGRDRRGVIVRKASDALGYARRPSVVVIDGVRWALDGGYRGLNWEGV